MTTAVERKHRQLKSRIKTDCGGGDEVKNSAFKHHCIPAIPGPTGAVFPWLSMPGDYRVTDEALFAETT